MLNNTKTLISYKIVHFAVSFSRVSLKTLKLYKILLLLEFRAGSRSIFFQWSRAHDEAEGSNLLRLINWSDKKKIASYRALLRIFCLIGGGANLSHIYSGIERVFSWTFCFLPYTEGCLKDLKETNHNDVFCLVLFGFSCSCIVLMYPPTTYCQNFSYRPLAEVLDSISF